MENLTKLFESIKNVLLLIDGRIRLWGAIIILVFSLIVLLLFNKEIPFNEWYVYLFFILAIVIALAGIIDLIASGRSENTRKVQKINRSISGMWCEIMLNHKYVAFSRLSIKYNPAKFQFELSGEAFDTNGEEVANWKSIATALTSFSPIKLLYFWEGKRFKGYEESGGPKAEGAGVLDFTFDNEEQINVGMGHYVSEITNMIENNVQGKRYETKIRRLNAKEIELIKTERGRQKFIKKHL